MKFVAIIALLGLALIYVGVGMFGFMMSVFCFDSGTEPANWQCFLAINGIVIGVALLGIGVGVVLAFKGRYALSIVVAAIPAMLVGLLFLAMNFFGP